MEDRLFVCGLEFGLMHLSRPCAGRPPAVGGEVGVPSRLVSSSTTPSSTSWRWVAIVYVVALAISADMPTEQGDGVAALGAGGNPHSDGKPVSAVLKRELGKRHAVVCQSVEVEEPAGNGHVLGLDRNGGQVADSDGEVREMPDLARLEAQARRLQRRLSRRRKGSKRREKAKRHLAKVRRRIASRRHNWHHHVSRKPSAKAGTVAVEGLNVKGMTRSAKGTAEAPGTMVAQKAGTNRVILNTGWTALRRMLDCKAANVIVVPAGNTSRKCHECGAVEAASRRTRDDFSCLACGHAAHADLNAAKNIRGKALTRLAAMNEASGTGASGVPG